MHQSVTADDNIERLSSCGKYTVLRVPFAPNGDRNIADLLLVPQDAGSYPAVIFNHGTSLMATDYKDLLSHVASHGYIVMAPQIYNPLAVVTTSVKTEQAKALATQVWVAQNISSCLPAGVSVDSSQGVFVAGHSRGGGVAYLTATERPHTAPAVAGYIGVDPVDTKLCARETAHLQRGQAWFTGRASDRRSLRAHLKAQTIAEFYSESTAPSWHVVADAAGHMDLLDDQLGWISRTAMNVCKQSKLQRSQVRPWLGGLIVAFLQDTVQRSSFSDPFVTGTSKQSHVETFLNSSPSDLALFVERKQAAY
eukprot:CAMPEP_0114327088 /NCGR_PEP_ID=MMETSP0059-20121206/30107_1 /TAXON_ID=36894 /ORGANISM="Pyramimonas parkeae, Strain CCMP726" /LENGTH=308 /DNA_ID=CAMNT_0001456177 /DNA_START=145 /DNA_END=1071 /DNA_ORIENTATION=-